MAYKKILEFYKVTFEILTRKGAKLIMKIDLVSGGLVDSRIPQATASRWKIFVNLLSL